MSILAVAQPLQPGHQLSDGTMRLLRTVCMPSSSAFACSYEGIESVVGPHLKTSDRILVVGCGNSGVILPLAMVTNYMNCTPCYHRRAPTASGP